MKKIISAILCVSLCLSISSPAFATSNVNQVTQYEENLGNDIVCTTTVLVDDDDSRSTNKTGSIIRRYTRDGIWIGTATLNGSFTYNGRTATATSVSATYSTASDWAFKNKSISKSGASVHLSAKLYTNWCGLNATASLTCSPNGVLS